MKSTRCLGFGTKYDAEDPICIDCESSIECRAEQDKEQFEIAMGTKCKAIETKKNSTPITAYIHKFDSKTIQIDIRIDIQWLKERIGKEW